MTNRWVAAAGMIGVVCAGTGSSGSGPEPAAPQDGGPALVVLLSVDQMRPDYIDRFSHEWEHGLKRLLDGGILFIDVRHDHAFTATAPGHATLATGVHPSRHGVVSNDWFDRVEQRGVYAVEDRDAPIVGFPDLPGRSPRNLLVDGVADWLQAHHEDSKVVSLAIKDRVAVTLGGRSPDLALWYEYQSGRYVTSTYYRDDYPDWVTAFNDSGPVHDYVETEWTRLHEESRYNESREDAFAPEGERVGPAFPHAITGSEDGSTTAFADLPNTPFGDRVTLALARRAVLEMQLGADDVPDLLAIGASSADLVGHRYGPYSQEVQDYYFRFDQDLGAFLEFLDEEVGEQNWKLVLSSDHGVAPMPEESLRRGIEARRVETADFRDELITGLQRGLEAGQIFAQPRPRLIYPLGVATVFEGDEVTDEQARLFRAALAEEVVKSDVITSTITYDQLLKDEVVGDAEMFRLFQNSFHPDRAADVILIHPPHYPYPAIIPATHGSPYDYDARVPLLVYGFGARKVNREITTVDVAPTVAHLLGVPVPENLDGTGLWEVTEAR